MAFLWHCVAVLLVNFILEATDGLVQHPTCVIGAGFAGLATSRHLKEYGVDFKVLEATRYIGGTWRFDPHVGTDQDGIPLFTSMYKNLRTNTPRQTMEFAGYPMPEGTPSYPASTCYYRYLKAFAKHFGLKKHVQFQSLVTYVKWAGDHWNVTYTRTDTRTSHTEPCGFLIFGTGRYRKVFIPKIRGLDAFKGNVLHSHDYKDEEEYRGRRVLLVGAGASGLDLATHLSNVTSKLIHSHHLKYNQPYFGPTYVKKPDIASFTSNGVIFEDDSFEEIDDVIFCTGYEYDYSYLDKNCGVTASNRFIFPLYQHVLNIGHPSMAFIGIAKAISIRTMEVQGQYAAALAANKFKLPSSEEMMKIWRAHVDTLVAKGKNMTDVNVIRDDLFQSLVTSIKWAGDHWNVTYTRTDSRTSHTDECGFLVIATGEYRKAFIPKFKGLHSFKGTVIHSHDYKDPEEYRGRRVLLVGAGASGVDLATHLSNVTSKLVHSHHLKYNQPYFGPTYVKKPDIASFTSNGVIFQDDSFEEVDNVILCTGYNFDYSFIDVGTGITVSSKFVLPLYQHTVNIRYPSMAFVGVSKRVINRVMEAQGQYVAALAAKRFQLPSSQEMLKIWLDHVSRLKDKGMKMTDVNVIGEDMDYYFGNLTKEAGVIRAPPVLTAIRDFNAKIRLYDLLNYRDYDFNITDDMHYERRYNLRKELPCPIEDVDQEPNAAEVKQVVKV